MEGGQAGKWQSGKVPCQSAKVAKEWQSEEFSTGAVNLKRCCKPLILKSLSGGAPARTRTWDQLIKSQLLYQLSYRGNQLITNDLHHKNRAHFSNCIPRLYPAECRL